MAVISRVTTWSDGQALTAAALNGEFNGILNDYNGNITNANISASAAISQSKLATLSITEALLSTSDLTTADVTTSKHGFVPKAPNDTSKFFRGDATWSALSSIGFGTCGQQASFGTTSAAYVDVTGATVTINPTASVTVKADVSGYGTLNTGLSSMQLQLLIDGVVKHTVSVDPTTASAPSPFALTAQASVASGARIIKLQVQSDGSHTVNVINTNITVIYG